MSNTDLITTTDVIIDARRRLDELERMAYAFAKNSISTLDCGESENMNISHEIDGGNASRTTKYDLHGGYAIAIFILGIQHEDVIV